jgi:hypothetical protein
MNKRTQELLEWGEAILNSEDWKASARARMLAGEAPHLERYLVQRIHGKPKEVLELQQTVPLFSLPQWAWVAATAGSDSDPEPETR